MSRNLVGSTSGRFCITIKFPQSRMKGEPTEPLVLFYYRCPKYVNIPPNWEVVKRPGECCPGIVIHEESKLF
jgi:hypothetical protein